MKAPPAAGRARSPRAWLARSLSPNRALEQRVLNATTWNEFTQEEVDARPPSMSRALTVRLANMGQAAAKAEHEALAAGKKAEHDARTALAAIDDLKRRTALRQAALEEEQRRAASAPQAPLRKKLSSWPSSSGTLLPLRRLR